jgi:hypothetical protein
MAQQVADSQFSESPAGHEFRARPILAKVNARRCAECGEDVFLHSRLEVDERDLMLVLDASSDDKASVIIEGELLVGSFKSMVAELGRCEAAVAVNCAGKMANQTFRTQ